MKRTCLAALFWALGALSSPSFEAIAAEGGMDIVLAIDTSGSMKKTDPHNLRAEAAKLFIHLLGQNDRLGLVTFDTTSRVLSDLKGAREERSYLIDQLRHIKSDGLYTNLHEAIRCSEDILKASARKRRAVIVMTDGKMDLGDPARDRELAQRLQDKRLPAMRTEGIRVFSIAFTEFSDIRFLKRVAFSTDGFFYLTLKDEDIHVTFTDIYDHMLAPDALPIRKEKFYVDRSVKELDIVITKEDPHTGIALEMPDRRMLTLAKHPRNVRWHQSRAFEMISIAEPLVGSWRIQYGADKGNRIFILTDLKLMTAFPDGLVPPDTEVKLEVWLHEGPVTLERKPVSIKDVKITAKIVPSGEEGIAIPLYDDGTNGDLEAGDGVYAAMIKPTRRGEHMLHVGAHGLTFEREKNLAFYVPEKELEDTLPPTEDLQPLNEHALPDVEAMPLQDGAPGTDWRSVLLRFLAINAVLALILSVTLILRRRRAQSGEAKKS